MTVELELPRAGDIRFDLQDVMGRTVQQFLLSENAGGKQVFALKTTAFPAGLYFLTTRLNGHVLATNKVLFTLK